jgi:lipopolysaccharide export system protein LptA
VILTGDVLTYSRREKTGRVEGRASLEGGEASGSAASARFELTGDERFLRSVTLERGARCSFSSGGKGPGGRVIEAETIRLQSFPEFSKVRSVDAVGNARLSLAASSGESGLVRAGEIGLALDREGRIESWTAAGDAFMDSTDSSGGKRELAAGTISFLVREGLLSARTSEGALARLESDEARIEAPTIGLAEGADNAEASNGVRCLLKPRSAGAPVGFFARGEPVFVTSRAMKSLGQERRLHFEGDVRAWQGEETLQAGELDVLQDTGGAGARKGVTAGFPHGGRDETHPRRIEAGGNEMTYTPSDRVVAFRGRSFVKIPDARLAAATVSVGFSEGEKRVKELRARTAVIFVFGDYEGRGDEAVYDPVAETLVLTGHPLLVEKGRGSSGGDKLTFRLGDGRILIENKGRGRSISVVKS